MDAIVAHRHGPPEVLVLEQVPDPRPGPGEVLIRVESAAVNRADLKRRRDDPYPFPTPLPYRPGSEVAGTVAALGDGVDGPPVGTPVFALVGADGTTGYAQFAVAAAAHVVPIPPGVGLDEASGLVVAGATALLALSGTAGLRPGETVLVQGAASGVGSYAVQLAKVLGAGTVIGMAGSPQRRAAARELGADEVVDSTAADWPDRVRALTGGAGVDVLLEMNGAGPAGPTLSVLAPFGRCVVLGMPAGDPLVFDAAAVVALLYAPGANQSVHGFNLGLFFGLRPAVAALRTLVGHVAEGRVRVPVGHVLPLGQAAAVHRLLEERRAIGKVVLKPWA